jgi:hypothetical protein
MQNTGRFKGECKLAARYSLISHLVINTVSSRVLASSNYVMQILSSPSQRRC